MNQFKPIFLGQIDPKHPMAKLKRAANSQKCIRAGGKHNDLEDVGKDTYHHTFFEMLGNWSFGDYFKKEAITWAWELLTQVYGLQKDRLYATYFAGNKDFGLEPDEEARQIWLQFLPAERVLPYGMKENFWEMGDTGPCGPCTEIHFDRIGGRDASQLVNADDATVIEIWNNVFMQFNREADRSLTPLPAKHVDTGMGLERIVSILQKKMSNYDTDAFTPIFEAIQKVTGAKEGYTGKLGAEDKDNKDMAYRVIADHIRTLTFAITDGATPSNDGRGYVLRRVLRRGIRYGREILKGETGFFSKLVTVVVDQMKDFFPELEKHVPHVVSIIREEEVSFEKTLTTGLKHFEVAVQNAANKVIAGKDAFTLYSTYGYPVDLTVLMAAERGMTVDMVQYHEAYKEEQAKSRGEGQFSAAGGFQLDANATAALNSENVPTTDDSFKYILGDLEAKVLSIFTNKIFVDSVNAGDALVGVILDRSNFYSEAGGQIYDTGVFTKGSDKFVVESVHSYAGYVLHVGKLTAGSLKVNDKLHLHIDDIRRRPIMSNHTATHFLNYALRKVLGNHIDQKGSFVDAEKLRFDFSHNKPLTEQEVQEVDKICSEIIQKNLGVFKKSVDLESAKSILGVRAVFGETYPDPVTVVSIGKSVEELLAHPGNAEWMGYSVEFCGGTHLEKTGDAKLFATVSEGGIAKGIRRIIAFTGEEAQKAYQTGAAFQQRLDQAAARPTVEELEKDISSIQAEIDIITIPSVLRFKFHHQLEQLIAKVMTLKKNSAGDAFTKINEIAARAQNNNTPFIVEELDVGGDRKAMSNLIQALKEKCPDSAICLFTKDSKTVYVFAAVPPSLTSKISAGDWAKEVAAIVGGKGGGKPEAAQASGNEVNKYRQAFDHALNYAASRLK
jgi:alanyl-tRNA synthetase